MAKWVGRGGVGWVRFRSGQSGCKSGWPIFFKQIYIYFQLQKKINDNLFKANELHLIPLVNILPILTFFSMIKIIYSHKLMMKKNFNVNNSLSKCI